MKKIISCSRKSDYPAFYMDYIQQALREGYVMVKSPYQKENTIVYLSPEEIHSIVLWSKNYANVIKNPGLLDDYNLFFQFTKE